MKLGAVVRSAGQVSGLSNSRRGSVVATGRAEVVKAVGPAPYTKEDVEGAPAGNAGDQRKPAEELASDAQDSRSDP